jgi:hypothetical protein
MMDKKNIPAVVVSFIIGFIVISLIFQYSWNLIIADIFDLGQLSIRESMALLLIFYLLKLALQSNIKDEINMQSSTAKVIGQMTGLIMFCAIIIFIAYILVGGFGF